MKEEVLVGRLAITDKRLILVDQSGKTLEFQAIYDAGYARQNWGCVLTRVSSQKVMLGGDYLLLRTRNFGSSGFMGALIRIASLGHVDFDNQQWDLRLKMPLVMTANPEDAAQSESGTETWFAPILSHAKKAADIGYSSILEIAQVKSSEINRLLKELEAGGPASTPNQPETPLGPSASVAPTIDAEPWMVDFLRTGEQVRFRNSSTASLMTGRLKNEQCIVLLTDQRVLFYSIMHNRLLDSMDIGDLLESKYRKVRFSNVGYTEIRGSKTKLTIAGEAPEMEALQRLIEGTCQPIA